MRFSYFALTTLAGSFVVSGAPTVSDDEAAIANLAKEAYSKTKAAVLDNQKRSLGSNTCTLEDIRVRREWGSLSKEQRSEYIRAVKCLQDKPARTPSSVAGGAKTRFDDWIVTHINQTLTIHYTGNFLSWHRLFTYYYEQALVEECGFTGDQPVSSLQVLFTTLYCTH